MKGRDSDEPERTDCRAVAKLYPVKAGNIPKGGYPAGWKKG